MKTVRVRAANLKKGDILEGRRIHIIDKYGRKIRSKGPYHHKLESVGVLVITPNPDGYARDVFDFRGDEFITVKRPKYNMNRGK